MRWRIRVWSPVLNQWRTAYVRSEPEAARSALRFAHYGFIVEVMPL